MKRMAWLCICLFSVLSASAAPQAGRLDPNTLVVMGGGLSAGMADASLTEASQTASYAALLARQMGTILPLPKFRDGGSVGVVQYDFLPGQAPAPGQSTLRGIPFPLFTLNLSIPFLRVSEALSMRPSKPLVVEGDPKRTLMNVMLGYPALIFENVRTWTPVEAAMFMMPTFLVVEMGFGDVAEAARLGDPARITAPAAFARDYAAMVDRLRGTFATILLINVPDPMDTAAFVTVPEAALLYRQDASSFAARLGLQSGDWIRIGGLVEIGDIFAGRRAGPLDARFKMSAAAVTAVRDAVRAYNASIAEFATGRGLRVFDLDQVMKEVRSSGIRVGTRLLGGGYLQGFYSSDGYFPTPAGQAVIANRLLAFINNSYGTQYPQVNVTPLLSGSPPDDADTASEVPGGEVVR